MSEIDAAAVIACQTKFLAAVDDPHMSTLGEAFNIYWGQAETNAWGEVTEPGIADEVWEERKRQHLKWGLQERPSGNDDNVWMPWELAAKDEYERAMAEGRCTWVHILKEEVYEAFAASNPEDLREELVQVMAVAASWIQDLDRRGDL